MINTIFSKNGRYFTRQLFSRYKPYITDAESSIFKSSIKAQLRELSHEDLLNTVENGFVAARLKAITQRLFCPTDVYVSVVDITESVRMQIDQSNHDWIFSFYICHNYICPNDEYFELPHESPRWWEILAMPHQELLEGVLQFVNEVARPELEESYEQFMPARIRSKVIKYSHQGRSI